MNTTLINIKVKLDDDNVPEEIIWEASESESDQAKNCEAMFLSMWDKDEKNSLNIDLWTKKMEIPEMNAFYFYTMMKMAVPSPAMFSTLRIPRTL